MPTNGGPRQLLMESLEYLDDQARISSACSIAEQRLLYYLFHSLLLTNTWQWMNNCFYQFYQFEGAQFQILVG